MEAKPPTDETGAMTGTTEHGDALPDQSAPRVRIARTKVSGTWIAVIVAVVGLAFLLVFILQNLTSVTVRFLGAVGTLPMGVAMLLAAVAGALLLALLGSARIMQLRRAAHRRDR